MTGTQRKVQCAECRVYKPLQQFPLDKRPEMKRLDKRRIFCAKCLARKGKGPLARGRKLIEHVPTGEDKSYYPDDDPDVVRFREELEKRSKK